MYKNIVGHKKTTTFGFVLIIVLVLKLFKINIPSIFDLNTIDICVYMSAAISAISNMFSKT